MAQNLQNPPRRKFWGWGYEGHGPGPDEVQALSRMVLERFGIPAEEARRPPRIEDLDLRPSRVIPPATLESICRRDSESRAAHTYGKSFRDLARAVESEFPHPPDFVAEPRSEEEVQRVLEWCDETRTVAIPYGGGSSVVGGVEAPASDDRPFVSIDLTRLDQVLEVDARSRSARIQGGVMGPSLESQLRPHGLTLRHFPQSFEFSTLGGWIATRSGGHYCTLHTHIDDFVQGLRMITPSGVAESRRLPGSGAGPSPDRLWIGSEGILGIITEAWMRLQDRPTLRASAAVAFESFKNATACVRALSQSGLHPANCRLLDAGEALTSGTGSGENHLLVVGFESADHDPAASMRRALEICRDHGGTVPEDAGATRHEKGRKGDDAVGTWSQFFVRAPYLREALYLATGLITETFETASTWDQFETLHHNVTQAVTDALQRICGGGTVTCRFTHVYPDGPAPYYTVFAPGRAGSQLEQWTEIKQAASEAIAQSGGTITHHHAVGRDHRPWYDRQRPDLFAQALRAAKREVDPGGILNPGVLIDPDIAPDSQPSRETPQNVVGTNHPNR
ncbi:FAD-binding oxidoreductase [Myxococcota bacterium]|nr:FAD-binding oxidoreductase [Myxococcota bacterium]